MKNGQEINKKGIRGSSMQFKSMEETVSMMQSLTKMMTKNVPHQDSLEFIFALSDLNLLANALQSEIEIIKLVHVKSEETEISTYVVNENGMLSLK